MTVTVDDAKLQLNIDDTADDTELALFVAAANEWIDDRVTDTTTSVARLATLFLIEHWWDSQRGPASTPGFGEDGVTIGKGYAIPNRVLELIATPDIDAIPTPAGDFPDAVDWPDPVEW